MRGIVASWSCVVLLMAGAVEARVGGDTMNWLAQELNGQWQRREAGVDQDREGGTRLQTSLAHQGGGVFRVNSTDPNAILARWNGRQVRLGGPVSTDGQGWTYFQLNGAPCRVGRNKRGLKIIEIHYGDRGQQVVMIQR